MDPTLRAAIHRWALISMKPGVGRSTSAIYMAQVLQDKGLSPLVCDADGGQTCALWDEEAGGLDYPVISKVSRSLDRTLPDLEQGRGAIIVDAPQLEDHAAIARAAMLWADRWIIPLAPSVVEMTRMFKPGKNGVTLNHALNDAQDLRARLGRPQADVVVLLTRTNSVRATKGGADSEVRVALERQGFQTLTSQIRHHDRYRQSGNTKIRVIGDPYERVVRELLDRPYPSHLYSSHEEHEDAP